MQQNNMIIFPWETSHETELFWKGYTHIERHQAIYELTNIIDGLGFITDSHMFSDLEIALRLQVQADRVKRLYYALCRYMTMDNEILRITPGKQDITINLNVTFTGASGNLRIEVPAVPG